MSNKTINQALKDLFLGLGGDPSALADNSTISDYIEDLESAIKGAASGELPEVTADDIGDVLAVVSDGASGASWGKGEIPSELPSVEAADIGEALIVESDGEGGAQWGKGSIPSGSIVFEASYASTIGNPVRLSNSKSGSDVANAVDDNISSGKSVYLYIASEKRLYRYFDYSNATGSNAYNFVWIGKEAGSNNLSVEIVGVIRSYDVSFGRMKYSSAQLPIVSSDDNDKILKVVNGAWAAVTP